MSKDKKRKMVTTIMLLMMVISIILSCFAGYYAMEYVSDPTKTIYRSKTYVYGFIVFAFAMINPILQAYKDTRLKK